MQSMNISITPELFKIVQDKVATGLYNDANEVVGVGVRLLFEIDAIKNKQIKNLNAEIDKGLSSLRAEKGIDGQSVYDELLARRKTYLD